MGAEHFKTVAEAIQASIVSAGILIGGVWTATTFVTLSEAAKAKAETERVEAERDKLEAEGELARRSLESEHIVNASITTSTHRDPSNVWWVVVEVSLSNTGTKPVPLVLDGNLRFYVSRVERVAADGMLVYGERTNLGFNYPDKSLDWFFLRPGTHIEKVHAVQKVDRPGLYLARFAVQVPDERVGHGREYGADTFFLVK